LNALCKAAQFYATFIPALLPLALLIFWLFRVWFSSTYRSKPAAAQSGIS
jgi:hypothetical protein